MGQISSQTFQRIYALYLIGRFPDGAFGAKRVQKTMFWAEIGAAVRPFAVEYHHHGQFSHELSDVIEQLAGIQHISVTPFASQAGNEGNRYRARDRQGTGELRQVLADADPTLPKSIDNAVTSYGFLPMTKLLELSYRYLAENHLKPGDVVVEQLIPGRVELPSFDDEACEDLEVAFSVPFLSAMNLIAAGIERSQLDVEKVEVFDVASPSS